jgi:hypothetical protein
MVKNLRKKHLQVWTLWAILLPLLIIASVSVIPRWPNGKLLQPKAVAALPTIVATMDHEDYTINLRKSDDTTMQLEWINKKVLTFPTATIYVLNPPYAGKSKSGSTNPLEGAELIGRIESRGTYRFAFHHLMEPPEKNSLHLILYDFIHEKIIETINY